MRGQNIYFNIRYVDTITYKYIAAYGSLKAITEVYSDGTLVDSANYTVSYDDGGRTYITFNSDQEDKKVTFNARGYMYTGMNSTNGHVENPAYVILFFFRHWL